MKKVVSMNYSRSTSSWKPWWWGLTWYLWWGLYTSILPTWIHSQNSLVAAETLSLKISSDRTSLKWSWKLSQSAWDQSKTMRWNRASHFESIEKSMETERTTSSEFRNGGKTIVKQIPALEEINRSKRAGL